ncbi:hypothetical protein KAR34_07135 [bacterium]|nr:hypothetical protein [bacterium]
MKISKILTKTRQGLLKAAGAFEAAKPWEKIYDSQIFGVENPQTREIGWCVIIGELGEVRGLNAYRGPEGLKALQMMMEENLEIYNDEFMAGQNLLSVTYVNKSELDAQDWKWLADCPNPWPRGLYPQFRSFRPGYYPWYLDQDESDWMTRILEQTLKYFPALLESTEEVKDLFSSQVPVLRKSGKPEENAWTMDFTRPEKPVDKEEPSLDLDEFTVHKLGKINLALESTWELDYFYTWASIQDADKPYHMRVALVADHENGLILGQEVISVGQDADACLLKNLINTIQSRKCRPGFVLVKRRETLNRLNVLLDSIGIRLELRNQLPAVKEAQESLNSAMAGAPA